jgi:hypothetical protein
MSDHMYTDEASKRAAAVGVARAIQETLEEIDSISWEILQAEETGDTAYEAACLLELDEERAILAILQNMPRA